MKRISRFMILFAYRKLIYAGVYAIILIFMGKCLSTYKCPVETTLDLIGGKYKVLILWHLSGTTLRVSELSGLIPRATPKMLTQQLRELERDNFLVRTVYPVVPPKVEYSLSEVGRSIIPVLSAMRGWGESYLEGMINKNT